MDWLIRRYHAEVEPIDQGILDDYGSDELKAQYIDDTSMGKVQLV